MLSLRIRPSDPRTSPSPIVTRRPPQDTGRPGMPTAPLLLKMTEPTSKFMAALSQFKSRVTVRHTSPPAATAVATTAAPIIMPALAAPFTAYRLATQTCCAPTSPASPSCIHGTARQSRQCRRASLTSARKTSSNYTATL